MALFQTKTTRYASKGCGLCYLYQTPPSDDFNLCCVRHDEDYDLLLSNPYLTSQDIYIVDSSFLKCMLDTAHSLYYNKPAKRALAVAKAHLYYNLARAWARYRFANVYKREARARE